MHRQHDDGSLETSKLCQWEWAWEHGEEELLAEEKVWVGGHVDIRREKERKWQHWGDPK